MIRIGVIGGYPVDFERLCPPPGIELHYIERDSSHLRIPSNLDAIIVVARFVNHSHWRQLRGRYQLIVVKGGWSQVKKAMENMVATYQHGVDSNERRR